MRGGKSPEIPMMFPPKNIVSLDDFAGIGDDAIVDHQRAQHDTRQAAVLFV